MDDKVIEALLAKLRQDDNPYFEQIRDHYIYVLTTNSDEAEEFREQIRRFAEDPNFKQMYDDKNSELWKFLKRYSPAPDERDRQQDRHLAWHLAVQDAIRELLEMKEENGEWFFSYQYQWFVIIVVLHEKGWLMTDKTSEFEKYLNPSHLNHILPNDYHTLPNPKKYEDKKTPHEISKVRTLWRNERDKYEEKGEGILPKTEDVFRKLLVKYGAK